ncbi:BLUF domain-containing protein [Rhizobium sp. SAFR-030]|uniref:BLUF domain-containing protein n=1 Tax=Rhizobium sp. SAFR-030 TaxID=3387277 RepID=UPI003F80C0F4
MPLYRLLYRSDIALSPEAGPFDEQIEAIVASSALANTRDNLSGALIASNGVFIQALEGPLTALETTFERICRDLRHRRVRLIELAAAEERAFPEWRMIRVNNKEDVLQLCSEFGLQGSGRPDALRTSAIIALMRSVLVSNASVATGAGFARHG